MEVKRRIKTFPRHNTWVDDGGGVYRSILSTTCRGFSVPASGCKFALLEQCSSDSVTQRPGVCAPCRRSFATGTTVPYDARPPHPCAASMLHRQSERSLESAYSQSTSRRVSGCQVSERPTVLRRDILKIGGSTTLLPLASVAGL